MTNPVYRSEYRRDAENEERCAEQKEHQSAMIKERHDARNAESNKT
ncbi:MULTISPECIES: hypothetical protein [unclassified Mycobacterium]|nr:MULTISPECIES: hypothetical protein [unclassified Mycobacterium]